MQQITDNREYPPQSNPPLLLAIGDLPWQYLKVILWPSVNMLRREARKARWGIVLFQLVLLVLVTIAFNALGHRIPGAALHSVAIFSVGSFQLFGWLPAPFNMIVFILATFFIGLGTAYPFSRLSKGTGTFVEHAYILLLFTVPLVSISGALLLIPAADVRVSLLIGLVAALFLYRMLLHVFTIMAVHQLKAERAVLIVLIIPILIALLLIVIGLARFLEGFDIPDLGFDFGSHGSNSKKKRKETLLS